MSRIMFYNRAINPAECISNGWKAYTQKFWFFFFIGAVTLFITAVIPVVSFFLYGPLIVGVYFCLLKYLGGEKLEVEDWFKGFKNNFLSALPVGLIYSITDICFQIMNTSSNLMKILFLDNRMPDLEIVWDGNWTLKEIAVIVISIVTILMIVLGWVMKIFLFFALPLIAEHDLKMMDAIRLSASAVRQNLVGVVLLWILEMLIILGGLILCCIGVFFVIPIVYAATIFAYRQVFPKFGLTQN